MKRRDCSVPGQIKRQNRTQLFHLWNTPRGTGDVQAALREFIENVMCIQWSRVIGIALCTGILFAAVRVVPADAKGPLTTRESEWLAAHPDITIAPDPNYPPIEYFDENGEYRGIAADYIALIEKKLGYRFKIVKMQSWDEILASAKNKQIDMFGAAAETPQRSEYMIFTTPFVEFPSVIIVRKDVKESLTLEQLSGLKVAIVSGYADHDYIRNKYPRLDLDVVPSVETGLKKVSFGMVDALVTNLAAATYHIEKQGITNLRLAGNTGYVYRLGFGVRKDWPELAAILQKELAQIGPSERDAIYKKWVHLGNESLYTRREFWVGALGVLILACLVMAGLLVWNRSLKSLVDRRTQELNKELAEHRRTEAALRDSEQRFRSLVETTSDWVWEVDLDNRYTYVSPKVKDLLGYEVDEVIGRRPSEFMHEDEAKRIAGLCTAIVESRGPFARLENTNLHKDGRYVVLETSGVPILDEDGNLRGYRGIDRDITDRIRAEEALKAANKELERRVGERTAELTIANQELQAEVIVRRRAEEELTSANERLRVLFAYAPDAYFLVDLSGNLVDGNMAAEQISGYSLQETAGKNILKWGLLPHDQLPKVRRILAGSAQGHPSGPDEFTFTCKDGRQVELEVRTFPTRIGGQMLILGIARDITARKETEKALLDSERRLRFLSSKLLTAQEEERRRVARELHDSIGQYLAAVKFNIEGVIGANGLEGVENMKRLENLVPMIRGAIEEVRRIYTGLRPSILDDLGILVTIDWFCREIRKTYPNIQIDRHIDAKESKIRKSLKIVIFRVIQEALNNVAKHSGATAVSIFLREEEGEVELIIEDDGVGFDVDEALSRDSQERGLGLTGMKERVELSGGVLAIESVPGDGTRLRALWAAPRLMKF